MKDDFSNPVNPIIRKKAELIHYGEIFVSEKIKLPYPLSSSTAGPGAGIKALALSFGGTRLKLGVTNDVNSKFSLVKTNSGYQILRDKKVFIRDVEIIPTLLHAPNQAFVNLQDGCIYDCKFCVTPILTSKMKKVKNNDQILKMILKASENKDFQSVAITSGIAESPNETIGEIIGVVEKVKENLEDVEIGVEPYILDSKDIDRLQKAGATEIKINIETFDKDIFKKICPNLDYDHILYTLGYAVKIFGKGKVSTNILIGLGESDENVLNGVEYFAKRGVVPVLRAVRINDYNYSRIVESLGRDIGKVNPERMIKLAIKQKEILNRYNLTTKTFQTMCHKCGCCDIVPFKDV